MTARLISPSKTFGFSNLYLDFLAGHAPASSLFLSTGYRATAEAIDACSFRRTDLVKLLHRQNSAFGASEKTLEVIRKLGDSRAVCLFAGQQAGIVGGPLFSLIKGLAVVKAAKLREQELGRPVIPVFWIAADDHDFAEVNHTYLLNHDGELVRLEYAGAPELPLPVADITLEASRLDTFFSQLQQVLGDSDFTSDLYQRVRDAYQPGQSLVDAFGRWMAGLTADYGLVLFSPSDPEAKRLAAPLFTELVNRQQELQQRLHQTNERIESTYHLQVQKSDQATHLFFHRDGRWPIFRREGAFEAGSWSFSQEELLAEIEERPERFSPDVLARPLMQSFLFPTVGQLGGPAEIAYFAQINPLFDLFRLPVPVHTARPSVTLVEKRHERTMAQAELQFEELTGDFEQVINRVMAKSFPQDIDSDFQQLRAETLDRFSHFSERSLGFDSSLKEFAQQTAGKIDFSLKAFEGKLFASHKKKQKEVRERLYRLWHALYPNRGFQDRSLNICYFIAKYGTGIGSFMHDRLDPDESAHQLISLAEFKD